MSVSSTLQSSPYGLLRVFLRLGDSLPRIGFWQRIFPRSVSGALLLAAKRQKLAGAAARRTDCGFVGDHPINAFSAEATAFDLPVCVELLGTREQLETFCETNADLLRGRVVVYQDIEQWQCHEAALTAAR